MSEAQPATEDAVSKEPTKAELAFKNATRILRQLIDDGVTDENELGKELIINGVGFAESKGLLKKVLEAEGIRLSASDRYELVAAELTEKLFAPQSYEEVESAIQHFASTLSATNEAEGRRAIERWAKKNDVVLPDRPKGRKGGGVASSVRRQAFAKAIELAGEADGLAFNSFITGMDPPQATGSVSVYNGIAEVARAAFQAGKLSA